MATFRVERTRDYTVMSNFHLRDKRISLKAKGLLSLMLSLPDDWDYTLVGLAQINRESKDAIRSAIKELEAAGYVIRHQTNDAKGHFSSSEYIIYERPTNFPTSSKPSSEIPTTVDTTSGIPTQINTKGQSKEEQNKDLSNIDSFSSPNPPSKRAKETMGKEAVQTDSFTSCRAEILKNIDYSALVMAHPAFQENLDEIVELIVETICTTRKTIRIAGDTKPIESVRARFRELNNVTMDYVIESLKKNTTEIRNIKQYLLAVLYNAPLVMNNHFSTKVNHDLATFREDAIPDYPKGDFYASYGNL